MQNIETIAGKLLYLAHEMFSQSVMNRKQKSVFKDLIFGQSPSVFSAYDSYLSNGTLLTLKSDLISIVRKQKDNENWQSSSSNSKKSSKKGRSMKIMIPPRTLPKMPAQMNRI